MEHKRPSQTNRLLAYLKQFSYACVLYEVSEIPANSIRALINPGKVITSRSVSVPAMGAFGRIAYYSSGTTFTQYGTTSYGVVQAFVAPALSGAVLTMKTPNLNIRGHTTYLTSTYFNALTDIRYQWVMEIYRVPKGNLNLNGWGQGTQGMYILDCLYNNSQKLI